MKSKIFIAFFLLITSWCKGQSFDGLKIGVLTKGRYNAITDISGVRVGHTTLVVGDSVRTGVTAVLPHGKNIYQNKVPAAIYIGNGYGKLSGISQVEELGNLESPIVLTNTLSVPVAMNAVITHSLQQTGNAEVMSFNALVGETNDGYLNDIRGRHVKEEHVLAAIKNAETGKIDQGNVGAGTGTVCFGYKGGIGTASRILPKKLGGYTVGVLVQTNFGGVLQINGVEVGEILGKYYLKDQLQESADGSCMIVVATDAPLDARNLKRLARRAFMGLAKTGGIASNGSGDYVIAFSTAYTIPSSSKEPVQNLPQLQNDQTSPLFMAAIEATEEAIIQSLLHAQTMKGYKGRLVQELPEKAVFELLEKHKKLKN